jgi:ubiquinone/menaquinone biosynthesis C-methylase UbiE
MPIKIDSVEYREHIAEEKATYSKMYQGEEARGLLFEPAPQAWILLEARISSLLTARTGRTRDEHIAAILNAGSGRRLLSLGCGPGGVELSLARLCPEAAIHGIDLNPDLLKMGQDRARDEHLSVTFEEADLNTAAFPAELYEVVFCHASMHHVLELEHLADQIKRTLKPGGRLIVEDVIMRNGSLMWPETKDVVASIWRTLPASYRINHTGYADKQVDAEPWEADTSAGSMECIRSEDVLPVLERWFRPIVSLNYLSLGMRFFHHMYGPNFDLSRPFDAAFFEWIWQLDALMVATSQLRGELHFGVYAV